LLDNIVSYVTKIITKKYNKIACPTSKCTFCCDQALQSLLEEHVKKTHPEQDEIVINNSHIKQHSKRKKLTEFEKLISIFLRKKSNNDSKQKKTVVKDIIEDKIVTDVITEMSETLEEESSEYPKPNGF
jgi:hypothetical protein